MKWLWGGGVDVQLCFCFSASFSLYQCCFLFVSDCVFVMLILKMRPSVPLRGCHVCIIIRLWTNRNNIHFLFKKNYIFCNAVLTKCLVKGKKAYYIVYRLKTRLTNGWNDVTGIQVIHVDLNAYNQSLYSVIYDGFSLNIEQFHIYLQ